jgi:hypothetical protein
METLRTAVDRLNASRAQMMSGIASTAKGIALNAADMIGGEAALGLYQDVNQQLRQYRNEQDDEVLERV